jgi:hypothetical protein
MKNHWYMVIAYALTSFTAAQATRNDILIPLRSFLSLANTKHTRVLPDAANNTEDERTYGGLFLDIFQENIEDGFFGGVKWGIAACLYQILYEFSSEGLSAVFSLGRIIKRISITVFNHISNRPAAIDVRTLSVLTQLLGDTIAEFEETLSKTEYDSACKEMHRQLVRSMCIHISEYLNTHHAHYAGAASQRQWLVQCARTISSSDNNEIAFVITLIVKNLATIVERLDEETCHKELMRNARATLLALGRLSTLLSNIRTGMALGGAQNTWFSGKY